MTRDVPSRDEYLDRWRTSHGGYDPRTSRVVGPWLTTVYLLARPLARTGVPPDAVTALGLAVSGLVVWLCALGGRWVLLAAFVVAASGLLDSLDGAVAVLTDRATRWGAVLDSVVDRASDGLYLVALWLVGAPAGVCVAAGAVVAVHEYARARATAVGMDDIGVVTVGERPTRVIVVAMFLLGAGVCAGVGTGAGSPSWWGVGTGAGSPSWWGVGTGAGSPSWWATLGAWASLVIGAVALAQLLAVVRRRLA